LKFLLPLILVFGVTLLEIFTRDLKAGSTAR
jgi:hypothetical protein